MRNAGLKTSKENHDPFDSDYRKILNRAIGLGYELPSKQNQVDQNQHLMDLKANNMWYILDVYYVASVDSSTMDFATLNWKDPHEHQLNLVDGVFYHPKEGFQGNGGYINTNFNPEIDGKQYTINDAGVGIYQSRQKAATITDYHIFSSGTVGEPAVTLLPIGEIGMRINNETADYTGVNEDNTSITDWHLRRSNIDNISVFKNGLVAHEIVVAPLGLPKYNIILFAASSAGVISNPTDYSMRRFWAGSSLKGKEKLFSFLFQKYLASHKNVILSQSSYCWFTRDIGVYDASSNKTFIGQVHNNNNEGYASTIVQVDHNNNDEVSTFRLSSVAEFDDHNEPSILIRSSDNKLFSCYAEHSGPLIRYRVSTNPLDATAWDVETTIAPGGTKYSYVSCFEDATGQIWLFFRDDNTSSLRGWSYVKSTDGGLTFGNYKTFFFGEVNRGYLTFAQDPNNKDLIHFVGSGGHPANTEAVDVYHFYLNCATSTLHKSDGTDVTAFTPLEGLNMTKVMDNILPDTGWFEDITVDNNGYPRVLMTKLPNGKNNDYANKDLYYSEWNGSAWTTPHLIHRALSRSIQSPNSSATTPGDIRQYPPNSSFDKNNPDIIYAAKEVNGVTEIFKLTKETPSSFISEQKTFNSLYDNWRPQAIKSPHKNVMWLNKIFYPDYINYDQQLILEKM